MSTKGGTAEQSPFRPFLEDYRAFFITPHITARKVEQMHRSYFLLCVGQN
jgi:hypothetical protein